MEKAIKDLYQPIILKNGKHICLNCGIEFDPKRDTEGKYHNGKCWAQSNERADVNRRALKGKKLSPEHVEKMAASKRNVPQTKETIEKRTAHFRNPDFRWKPETIKKRADSNRNKRRTGQALKNIQDGNARSFSWPSYSEMQAHPRKRYSLKFEKDQKAKARERDGYKCFICGSTEKLEVHHIIDVRRFLLKLQDSEAHDLRNLITLCESCHKKLKGFKKNNYIESADYLQGAVSD